MFVSLLKGDIGGIYQTRNGGKLQSEMFTYANKNEIFVYGNGGGMHRKNAL